ncbi:ATP-grasp domain-containing protein [Embleya sp. NBC_00896]|uniref:ATP-grasp domain-containing protein n=1 Tax=Embleya sp. NBC_00896 TaxID=2975961 RepID=UPI0038649171|nr:ATP-grasp domain-containing protein [Embleya sp. NBC_00896]
MTSPYREGATAGLLVPADPLNPRRTDPHFAPEAEAALALGIPVARVDHDALVRGDAHEAVRRVPLDQGPLRYRGWMIPATRYAELDAALRPRGASLATPPERYRAAHELPGWYEHFRALTPHTVDDPALLGSGAAIVKDWVKSRKHEWHEACFVPDVADTAHTASVVRTFVERQGTELQGAVVYRAFESFTGAEARVWWVDGDPVLTTAHPDTPAESAHPTGLDAVGAAVTALGSPFCTTDLAQRQDGVWRVVEVGDGQVSDLPAGVPAAALLGPLFRVPR